MKQDLTIEEVRKMLAKTAQDVPYKIEANKGILDALQDGLIAAFIDVDGVLKFTRIEAPTKKVEWGFGPNNNKLRLK